MRVTRARLCSWSVVVLALLSLAGCGGSTGAPSAHESAAYASAITHADAICRRLNTQLAVGLPKHFSLQAVASISPRNAALEQRAVGELARLEPPASIAREWRQVIVYRTDLANELTQVARAAKAGNTAAVKRLGVTKTSVRKKLLTLGQHVGFSACQELG
jgi:hypothetical protein